MPSFEIILSAFLAISLTASIISSRARAPYTIILVLFGVAIAGSSLSSILGVSLLYDSLVGGGLFVGLVLPPLLFETTMNIRFEEFRAVARPALRLATVGVVIATVVGGIFLWQIIQLPLLPSRCAGAYHTEVLREIVKVRCKYCGSFYFFDGCVHCVGHVSLDAIYPVLLVCSPETYAYGFVESPVSALVDSAHHDVIHRAARVGRDLVWNSLRECAVEEVGVALACLKIAACDRMGECRIENCTFRGMDCDT